MAEHYSLLLRFKKYKKCRFDQGGERAGSRGFNQPGNRL